MFCLFVVVGFFGFFFVCCFFVVVVCLGLFCFLFRMELKL